MVLIIRILLMDKKKTVKDFPRIHSYKELYQFNNDFLNHIADEDVYKAEQILSKITKNKQTYSFIIGIIRDKHSMQKKKEELTHKIFDLSSVVDKLKKQNESLRKKNGVKFNNQLDNQQVYQKIKILEELESNRFQEACILASRQNHPKILDIAQKLWEYEWMIHRLQNKENSSSINSFKDVKFKAERAGIRSLVEGEFKLKDAMNKQLLDILGNIIDPVKTLKINDKLFSPIVGAQLRSIGDQIKGIHQENSLALQEEERIITKILRKIPDLHQRLEKRSFYKILQQVVDRKDFGLNGVDDSSSHPSRKLSYGNEDLSQYIPEKLLAVRSVGIEKKPPKRTEKDIQSMCKKIKQIDIDMKKLKHQIQNRFDSYELNVLENIHETIKKWRIYEDTHQVLVNQEEEQIKKLKEINRNLIELNVLQNPIDISEEPHNLKVISEKFFFNMEKALQSIQNIEPYPVNQNSSDSLVILSRQQSKQVANRNAVSIYEEEFHQIDNPKLQNFDEDIYISDEEDSVEKLSCKNKQQLIDIIQQLRGNIQREASQRATLLQNCQSMQKKCHKIQRQLKESIFLMNDSEEFPSEENIAKLKNTISELEEQINRKNIELQQIKQRNIELFNEKKEYEMSKQEYNDRIKMLEERNEKNDKFYSSKEIVVSRKNSRSSEYFSAELRSERITVLPQKNETKILQEGQNDPVCVEIGVGNSEELVVEGNNVNQDETKREQKIEITSSTINQTENAQFEQAFCQSYDKIHKAEIQKLLNNITVFQQNTLELEDRLFQQQKLIEDKNLLIEEYSRKIEVLEYKCSQLSKELEEVKESLTAKPQEVQNQHLFVLGSIFTQYANDQRLYLIETLTNFLGPIKKTNLLYRFDALNKTNPHRYIDNHRHIVLIAKTIYGRYIAAYSRQPISSTGCKVSFGLIISLWKKMTFQTHKNKRAVTYDDFFIIFGNSELRIKSQESKIFSNFGINNGFFNTRGHKVDSFLGERDDREVALEGYEVYKLDLQKGN